MAARPPGYATPNMQQQRYPSPGPPMASRYQQVGYPGPPQRQGYPMNQMGPQMGQVMHSPMGQRPHMGMGQPGMPPPPPPQHHQGYPATTSSPSSSAKSGSSHSKSKDKESSSGEGKKSESKKGMHRSGMAAMQASMDRKRPADQRGGAQQMKSKKKKKIADKILPQRVRDLVPESQAYMDLLSFERKLDSTIMRKRLDIQEALKRPMRQKKKLRIFISNTFYPAKHEEKGDGEESVASWELRVEGRLLEDQANKPNDPKLKRKFSSFFKSLVIELDKDLYGPDNHLVEWHRSSPVPELDSFSDRLGTEAGRNKWHRTPTTQETDGFQVKRPGDQNVKCTVLLMLDYQPMQFKLDPRLARLLGVHTQTRPVIINALWQYIKTHHLQDQHEREYINCDKYLEQIFECQRMKFSEIPQRLHPLLMPPDPIVINHVITVEGPDAKKTACYDIDVEIDDTLKQQMNNFLLSTQSQQEISTLDSKIHETVETINQLKTSRDFLLSFAKEPQEFINNWLVSQCRDLKTMTDVVGNPEEERKAEYFYEPWSQEAVCRYFYGKVQQRRAELENSLSIRNT